MGVAALQLLRSAFASLQAHSCCNDGSCRLHSICRSIAPQLVCHRNIIWCVGKRCGVSQRARSLVLCSAGTTALSITAIADAVGDVETDWLCKMENSYQAPSVAAARQPALAPKRLCERQSRDRVSWRFKSRLQLSSARRQVMGVLKGCNSKMISDARVAEE